MIGEAIQGLPHLARRVLHHWRENPVCRRLWVQLRPYAFIIAGINFFLSSSSVAAQLFSLNAPPAGATALLVGFVSMGVGCLNLVLMGVIVAGPLWYPVWAWRRSWERDDNLRLSPLTARERLAGMLCPFVALLALYVIPALLVSPVSVMLSSSATKAQMGSTMYAGPISFTLLMASMITASISWFAVLCLWFGCLGTRRLLQHPEICHPPVHKWGGIVLLYLVALLILFVWGIVRGIVIYMWLFDYLMQAFGSQKLFAMNEFVFWAGYCFAMLIDVLSVAITYTVVRRYWDSDLAAVGSRLFLHPMES